MLKAGFKVAIRPASDNDLPDSLFTAGLFLSGGLTTEKVIQMMTAYPAELLGVGNRVGTLAAGKDADFVVLNGDPFGTHTRVLEVFVDGKSAYATKTAPKATVVQARSIYTGSGEIIPNGSVLIEGGTVRGLGRDVSAPADAIVRRYSRGVVVPGFVDFGTGLGLGGPLTAPVALGSKLGERLVSGDAACGIARQGGVTTVLLASGSGGTGPVIAFKLGDKPHVIKDPVAIRFSVTGNLTSAGANLRATLQAGKAYADTFARYEIAQADYLKKKQEFDAAKARPASTTRAPPGAPQPKRNRKNPKRRGPRTNPASSRRKNLGEPCSPVRFPRWSKPSARMPSSWR